MIGLDNNKEVWEFKKEDLFTVPNILTYFRFLLIVPFVCFFLNNNYVVASVCIILSGLTDCFDGFFARRLNQVTSLGKILDPIADKLTLLAVIFCMILYVPAAVPVLIILLVKDILMLLGGTDLIKRGLTPPAAKWYGKLATIVFYVSVCLIVFLKAVFLYESLYLELILFTITALTMLFALYKYGKIYINMVKEDIAEKSEKVKQ